MSLEIDFHNLFRMKIGTRQKIIIRIWQNNFVVDSVQLIIVDGMITGIRSMEK